MSELWSNVPLTTRSYEDGTSGLSLIRRTGEAGNRYCDPWIGSLACYPLHYGRCSTHASVGWLGGAKVLGKLPVPGCPTNLI